MSDLGPPCSIDDSSCDKPIMVRQVTKTGDDRVLGPSTATILPGILVRQISKAEEESVIFPVIGSSDESLLVRQVTKPIDDQVLVESTFCDEPVALVRQVSKSEESISFPLSPRNLNMQSCHSNPHSDHLSSVDVLMIGTGEYTTGFVHGSASNSDKGAGVVALTMIDLRRKGKTKRLGLCGVNGTKFPAIRDHMKRAIADVYNNMDISVETFPADDDINPLSYIDALDSFYPGDIVTIFTPDDTHFEIALAAIKRKLHVMITKPAVKTLEHHSLLHQAAIKNNVLVVIEVHKRWDPIYQDARDRIQKLGSFSYMYSYMSQPKHQLETFKSWAGKSSDISYYLNSHHIDFHEWCVGENSRPIRVSAMASTGVAKAKFGIDCEDTITLTVTWENFHSHEANRPESYGTAVYTSSWIAPKSDVHSQQRFFYMGQTGEVNIDQAHRGYNFADDEHGYRSINPLFMKYTPTDGEFSGQHGYGYRSFEMFIDAVRRIKAGEATIYDYETKLATLGGTYRTTAILEAGRRSLDCGGNPFHILYDDPLNSFRPTNIIRQ